MPARPRILIVNDDEDARFLLARSVRRALPDAEVATQCHAVAALDYFERHHVDAIVTDNTMPQMDGLTFVRNVRAKGCRIPILMVTNSSHLAAEAEKAGVSSYLPDARLNEVGQALAALLPER